MAMGLGQDLVVNLAGNNAKLKKTLKESQGGLKGFASAATSLLNPITAGLAAMAGAAVGAGVAIYGLTSRIAGLAGIVDESVKAGVSGAFLQRLGYAADQSGVSIETLKGGLKKLTTAIGAGDDKPFAKLGLSLKELQALNPEQQFMKVAAAIGKLPTAAQRASAAVSVFGKTGYDMTGLFAGGMNDLNALMADAEKLGIGISAEGLAKAAKADDAIQRMKASFGALLDQITVGVAPAFDMVATAIADLIPPVTTFIDKFNGMEGKVQFLGDLFESGLAVAFAAISEHWDTLLGEMIIKARDAGQAIAHNLNPVNTVGAVVGGMLGKAIGGPEQAQGETKLQAAQRQFAGVLARMDKAQGAQWGEGPAGDNTKGFAAGVLANMNAAKGKGDIGGIASGIADGAMNLFGRASVAATSKLTDMAIKGDWLASTVGNMFTGPEALKEKPEKAKREETRFAGAMQKGSAEAFSTIVAAMFGNKDPNVKATEKQTKEIVKAIKGQKGSLLNLVAEFAT